MPIERLRNELNETPVLLGPVDMGFLNYLPNHQFIGGCDHYVLALEMNDNEILLHDPAGYPFVWLSLEQLDRAWKAESVPWSNGAYRYWKSPKRVEHLSDNDIYKRSIQLYKEAYGKQRNQVNFARKAINLKAAQIKNNEISDVKKAI